MTLVLAPGTLLAAPQDAPSGKAPAEKQIKQLDTVQVSATKRETPLQKTPVAVSAISADTLDKERVMTVQDITKLVPGLQGTSQGDHGVVTLTLRGIGNDSAKTEYADPEVATFVDGVYSAARRARCGVATPPPARSASPPPSRTSTAGSTATAASRPATTTRAACARR
jgi:iron complex outermembrane receptor protein